MTFVEKIFQNLQKNSSTPWIHEVLGENLKTFSKQDFSFMLAKAQKKIKDLGVKKGDRVVLLGSNSASWIACDLAILSLEAITVPLYTRQDPKELAFMVQDSDPSLLIYSDEILKNNVLLHCKIHCKAIQLETLFSSNETIEASCTNLNSISTATMIYTSGTSGHPKGVLLNFGNIDFMLEKTTAQLYGAKKNTTNDDRVFHFLPLCFAGSRLMLWTQMFRDNPIYLSMDLKNLVQEMSTAAPMFYLNVPAILEKIKIGVESKIKEKSGIVEKLYTMAINLGSKPTRSLPEDFLFQILSFFILGSIRKKIGKNLKFLICGSAALHPETQRWFESIGIRILQVYGLTETTGIITMDDPDDVRLGFVGKPIDGVEIKRSDEGELLCKGPNVFSGYWNRPEETKNSFDEDGWYKTGDLAEITNTKHIRITGRIKNLIIPTSGHNIVPEPIEEQLQKFCTKIEHAILVGHGKPFLSIIVTGNISPTEIETAISQANQNVPHYRKIKTFFHFKDGFTIENGLLTANQKIKRRAVETMLAPQIEKIYSGAAL